MIVKNAYKPSVVLSTYSLLTIFLFGITTVSLLVVLEQPLVGVACGVIGVLALIFSICKDHKRQRVKLSDYTNRLKVNFSCPSCNRDLPNQVQHDDIDGLPILHFCESCDVLWYIGRHVRYA